MALESFPMPQGFHRGRRLRRTPALRDLVREHSVDAGDLIQPYFVDEMLEPHAVTPIGSMPGQFRYGEKALVDEAARLADAGVGGVILFGIPKEKDAIGSQGFAAEGIVQRSIAAIKARVPQLLVMTDVCCCEYTSHGHCGQLCGEEVENDATLRLLQQTAVSHARAGADIVAPSDMMDGRIAAIRQALDAAGFPQIPVLSYAVKYASGYYGPFREAADSTPAFGDRASYQMDPANVREALREAQADVDEGADMLMVKPGLPYLDIVRLLRDRFPLPLFVYQVSGEYAMLKAAAQLGWLDEARVALESLLAFKRAGADGILTYFAKDFASLT